MGVDEIYGSIEYDADKRVILDKDTGGQYDTQNANDMQDLVVTMNWLYGQLSEAKRLGFQPRYDIYNKMRYGA